LVFFSITISFIEVTLQFRLHPRPQIKVLLEYLCFSSFGFGGGFGGTLASLLSPLGSVATGGEAAKDTAMIMYIYISFY
jgi:hypothetical protein